MRIRRNTLLSVILVALMAVALAVGAVIILPVQPARAGERAGQTAAPTTLTLGASAGWQGRMLAKVNALRAAAGIRPLRMCPALTTSAASYARVMARSDHFGHVGPNGGLLAQRIAAVGYRADGAAENIAAGQQTVVRVMRAWAASPSHYASIMNPDYRHVGFGHARSADASYPSYWVQHFGYGGSCTA